MPAKKSKSKKRAKLTLSKINKKVNSLLNQVEKKYLELSHAYSSVTTSGNTHDGKLIVDGIAVGNNRAERIGEKIHLDTLQIRGQFRIGNGVANDAYNQIRMLVLMVKYDVHTADPTIDELLNPGPSVPGVSTEQVIQGLYRKNPDYQYKVLYDKVHTCYWRNASGLGAGQGSPQLIQFNIRRKLNEDIHYTDAGIPIGYLPYLIMISDSGAVTHPEISYNTRLTWSDL